MLGGAMGLSWFSTPLPGRVLWGAEKALTVYGELSATAKMP